MSASTTRTRITARGRRALAVLVAAPVIAVAGFGFVHGATANAGAQAADVAFKYVTVQPGQSLWQIAQSIAPHDDPRDVVANIEMLNDLAGPIQPGQALALPLEYTD